MWRLIQKNNLIWNFDATGSVINDIKGQKIPLFYSIVVHDNILKNIIPIGSFLTTEHSTDSICLNLTIIKNILIENIGIKEYQISPIIVVDHSWALISGVLKSFNHISTLQYLNWFFDLIVKKDKEKKFALITTVYICCTHMMKIIIQDTKKIEKKNPTKIKETLEMGKISERNRNALIYCFTLLQNSSSIEEFDMILENVYNIFNRKIKSSLVKQSIEIIKNMLILRTDNFKFDYYENEKLNPPSQIDNSKNIIQECFDYNNLKKSSPFSSYYFIKIKEFALKECPQADLINETNSFYNPLLFDIIKNRLYIVPLWSGFVFKRIHNLKHLTRASNTPVESSFSILKNGNLNKNKVMSSELIGNFYQTLISKYKKYYEAKAKQFFDKKSNEDKSTKQDYEKWASKRKKKYSKQAGYYKNSQIFGYANISVHDAEKINNFFDSNFETIADSSNGEDSNGGDSNTSMSELESLSDLSFNDNDELEENSEFYFTKFNNYCNECFANSALQSLISLGINFFEIVFNLFKFL